MATKKPSFGNVRSGKSTTAKKKSYMALPKALAKQTFGSSKRPARPKKFSAKSVLRSYFG